MAAVLTMLILLMLTCDCRGILKQKKNMSTEPMAKRAKSSDEARAQSPTSPAPAVDLSDFEMHEESGWYISRADPAWQYNAQSGLFFHAQQGAYFVFNVETGGFVDAADAAASRLTAAMAEPVAIVPLGVTVTADYTFMQGRRPHQEDRHTLETTFGPVWGHAAKFFAVFDGHGGSEASEYCAKTFHQEIVAAAALATGADRYLPTEGTITEAVGRAAAKTDKEFLRIAKIRKRRDGCCAVAAMFLGKRLVVVNIGDSRAVLCTGGQALPLSTDHKPEEPAERARIEAAGAQVLKYGPAHRVTTPASAEWEKLKIKPSFRPMQPAVARSFGDLEMKQPVQVVQNLRAVCLLTAAPASQYLVSTPDVTIRTLEPRDKFVILACDGVWDVLSNAEAAALVMGCAGDASLRDRAGAVVTAAYDKGSTDNISVVVISIEH